MFHFFHRKIQHMIILKVFVEERVKLEHFLYNLITICGLKKAGFLQIIILIVVQAFM